MANQDKPLSVVSALLGAAGNCFCEFPNVRENGNQGVQFMELHGVEYIGLGAVASELTAEQRVRDTVAQLTERTKRLIGVGYLVDTKVTDTIPLEVWEREYPDDRAVNRNIQKIINHIKVRPDKKKHREMFIRFFVASHTFIEKRVRGGVTRSSQRL
jgi:hypothetical protein